MKINVILIILYVVGAILCIVGGYPVVAMGFALNAANVAICIYDMVCDKHNKKG